MSDGLPKDTVNKALLGKLFIKTWLASSDFMNRYSINVMPKAHALDIETVFMNGHPKPLDKTRLANVIFESMHEAGGIGHVRGRGRGASRPGSGHQ